MKSEAEIFEDSLNEKGDLFKVELDIKDFVAVAKAIAKGERIKKLYVDRDTEHIEVTTDKSFYEVRAK